MKKIGLLLVISFGLSLFSYGQIDCSKFKTGTYRIYEDSKGGTFINRTKKYQVETDKESGIIIKLRVTWIDDCTYKLKFIKGNGAWKKLDHSPSNSVVIVKIIEIGEDYYIQESKFEGGNDLVYKSKMKKLN